MDWYDRPAPCPAAISEFRRLVTVLLAEYPYLHAEWDSFLADHGLPLVRLLGPAPEGPVLCLCLAGPSSVWVGRVSPVEQGWQSGTFDTTDSEQVADLEGLICDFAREHFAG